MSGRPKRAVEHFENASPASPVPSYLDRSRRPVKGLTRHTDHRYGLFRQFSSISPRLVMRTFEDSPSIRVPLTPWCPRLVPWLKRMRG